MLHSYTLIHSFQTRDWRCSGPICTQSRPLSSFVRSESLFLFAVQKRAQRRVSQEDWIRTCASVCICLSSYPTFEWSSLCFEKKRYFEIIFTQHARLVITVASKIYDINLVIWRKIAITSSLLECVDDQMNPDMIGYSNNNMAERLCGIGDQFVWIEFDLSDEKITDS